MRALIVYEDSHRSYGEAMVGAVRVSRPGLEEVALAHLRDLEAELERFDPHLVVSSRPTPWTLGGGRRGTNSPPSPASHPRPAFKGCARKSRTLGWRSCCRSSTKWRRSFAVGANWEAASLQRLCGHLNLRSAWKRCFQKVRMRCCE